MPTYRLLALDIDGTLLTSQGQLPTETKEAVQRVMALGLPVTLATGRGFQSARPVAEALGLTGPLVTHDGGYVIDQSSGQVYLEERMPLAVAVEAVRALEDEGLEIHALEADYDLCNRTFEGRLVRSLRRLSWQQLREALAARRSYPRRVVRPLAPYLAQEGIAPLKLWVEGRPERLAAGRRLLAEAFAERLRFTPVHEVGIEVTPHGVSKASGLKGLIAQLGLQPSQVMAIGDQFNDLEMLSFVGLGIAMGNAPEPVKAAADYITATSDEFGVAQAIERFLINPLGGVATQGK